MPAKNQFLSFIVYTLKSEVGLNYADGCNMKNPDVKVYNTIPEGFSPRIEVAGIYVNVEDKILFLQLADHKDEKGLWGVPAGKLEACEEPLQAARRELFEETGITVGQEAFQTFGAIYIRKPELDYVYHLFGLRLNTIPLLSLSREHCSYIWVSKEEAHTLPLVNGAAHALNVYYTNVFTSSQYSI